MAIKKAVKSTEDNEPKKGIKAVMETSDGGYLDIDVDDLIPMDSTQPTETSMQASILAEADKHPCYGNLINPPSESCHWHARQVQAELKVVLRGLSNRNKWWTEPRADKLIQQPCGLQENGYILCWVVDPEDFESYLLLEDIREHMKYAFGDRFVVRPVSELSEDAKGWKFNLGT